LKITDAVYALDSTKGNYVYVVLGKEIILIDTGRSKNGEGILSDLKSMNVEPVDINHIFITHHDMDHTGSLLTWSRQQVLKSGHLRRIFLLYVVKKILVDLKNLLNILLK
jgi:glyoxylase-like metal-dependent hydrolase (beta-lactamase superfamily II)